MRGAIARSLPGGFGFSLALSLDRSIDRIGRKSIQGRESFALVAGLSRLFIYGPDVAQLFGAERRCLLALVLAGGSVANGKLVV